MPEITIISDSAGLAEHCNVLQAAERLAIDTEFMREKTYAPVLALIQFAGAGTAACIDPLAIDDLSPLGRLLENPDAEIILHSCRQDLEALDTRMDEQLTNLFDTQIAAAFCGFGDQVSYAAMVEQVCGVTLAKSHTRADWTRRPLSGSELEYALDDVHYLEQVADFLKKKLVEQNRLDWFIAECREQQDPGNWRPDPGHAWQRLKGAAGLPVEAHATASALAVWRERRAIQRNLPREWVLSTPVLLQIARVNPGHRTELAGIEGVNGNVLKYSSDDIIGICADTPRQSDATPLWLSRGMLEPEQKRRVKGLMGILRETADKLGISPSLMANRAMIERYVRGDTDLGLFRGWRREVVGEKILASGI